MLKRARSLKRIGKTWAVVEGKLVIKGEILPKLGDVVYNSGMEVVGMVSGIFGPVNNFFIEVNPVRNVEIRREEPLYILEEDKVEKRIP